MALTDPKAGGWAFGEVLTSPQMNTVRSELLKCADFSGGGTYTPSAPVIVSGDGGGAGHSMSVANLASASLNATNVVVDIIDVTSNLDIQSGTILDIQSGGSQLVSAGGLFTVSTGATVTFSGTSNLPQIGTRTYSFTQPLIPIDLNGVFTVSSSGAAFDGSANSSALATFSVTLMPHLSTLTAVRIKVEPVGGHAGLPTQKPRLEVSSITYQGSESLLGATSDGSASVGAYEAAHDIEVSGLNESTSEKTILVRIRGEGGTNYLAGMKILGIQCDFECTEIAPG